MRSFAAATLLLLVASGCSAGGAVSASRSAAAQSPAATSTPAPLPTPTPLPALTLQNLFHRAAPPPGDAAHLRTLLVTGDIIPAREVQAGAVKRNDFLWPFRPTADYVKSADITFGDLEAPLFAGCQQAADRFRLCGDARFIDGLTLSGMKVLNLANNHFSNYGTAGITSTTGLLQKASIQYCGLGPAAVMDVRGIKFAFLGYNGVGLAIDRAAMKAGIENARQQADVVVVQFHWGKEYVRQPMPDPAVPTPDDPVAIGHLAIDDGADLVIGNHPHWYQGVEVYKDRLITYAHGNFVFDQMWSLETQIGVIGTYTFYDTHLVAATWKATQIYDYGQPRFMDDAGQATVVKTMEDASNTLATKNGEPTTG